METTHYVNWNNYLINRECITILRVTKCNPISFNTVISSVLDLLCGPDGLSHEMYSTFKDTLSPLLTNIFLKNVSIKKLTQSLQLTTIKVILKKNKDPDDPRHIGPLKFEHWFQNPSKVDHFKDESYYTHYWICEKYAVLFKCQEIVISTAVC